LEDPCLGEKGEGLQVELPFQKTKHREEDLSKMELALSSGENLPPMHEDFRRGSDVELEYDHEEE
jgi:hypothetical protein